MTLADLGLSDLIAILAVMIATSCSELPESLLSGGFSVCCNSSQPIVVDF